MKSTLIFLSYSTEDKEIVGALKGLLEKIGFEVFLAHEDIEPPLEWQVEILEKLKICDVFIPFLTNNFKESDWTDQETGVAIALGKLIIPLKAGISPYGFVGKIQGMELSKSSDETVDLNKTVEKIQRIIFEHKRRKFNPSLLKSTEYEEYRSRSPI